MSNKRYLSKVAEQSARIAELDAERAELQRRLEASEKRLRWYRAAHLLCSNEFAFVGHRDGDDARLIYLEQNENYDPLLMVLCSDTFAWACADCERAEYADAEAILDIAVRDGWVGLMRWVQERRVALGQHEEPIAPVRKMFADYDAQKARAADAERERDSARDELREAGEALLTIAAMDCDEAWVGSVDVRIGDFRSKHDGTPAGIIAALLEAARKAKAPDAAKT